MCSSCSSCGLCGLCGLCDRRLTLGRRRIAHHELARHDVSGPSACGKGEARGGEACTDSELHGARREWKMIVEFQVRMPGAPNPLGGAPAELPPWHTFRHRAPGKVSPSPER